MKAFSRWSWNERGERCTITSSQQRPLVLDAELAAANNVDLYGFEGGCRLSGSAAARVQSLVRRRCDASVWGGKTPINADSITRTPASP
jgi:hypothetical protein